MVGGRALMFAHLAALQLLVSAAPGLWRSSNLGRAAASGVNEFLMGRYQSHSKASKSIEGMVDLFLLFEFLRKTMVVPLRCSDVPAKNILLCRDNHLSQENQLTSLKGLGCLKRSDLRILDDKQQMSQTTLDPQDIDAMILQFV